MELPVDGIATRWNCHSLPENRRRTKGRGGGRKNSRRSPGGADIAILVWPIGVRVRAYMRS